ncbi:hypothetical protein MAA8898_05131 [Maliponia aquimaris]|uniref:Uncharacterized protein n=1 Tax=Maliponia aquimaris TaxID=1673631 RepID=A0A238L755_9RHOB|nr:hypothetical protein MAA8898_05131 [Maliponia aquimaris]
MCRLDGELTAPDVPAVLDLCRSGGAFQQDGDVVALDRAGVDDAVAAKPGAAGADADSVDAARHLAGVDDLVFAGAQIEGAFAAADRAVVVQRQLGRRERAEGIELTGDGSAVRHRDSVGPNVEAAVPGYRTGVDKDTARRAGPELHTIIQRTDNRACIVDCRIRPVDFDAVPAARDGSRPRDGDKDIGRIDLKALGLDAGEEAAGDLNGVIADRVDHQRVAVLVADQHAFAQDVVVAGADGVAAGLVGAADDKCHEKSPWLCVVQN